jgi:hypothetical protein
MLRSHAGWSLTSKMPQRYLHYFGTESSKSILQIKGVIKENEDMQNTTLKPRYCPNCNECNKPESKFCISCKMLLSYNAYNETINKQIQKDKEITDLNQKYEKLNEKINQMFELIQHNPKLSFIKPKVLDELI